MSLISAIAYDRIISNQLVEGGVDGILFENFIYQTLVSVRNDKTIGTKRIILLLDNATVHKT